MSLLGAIAEVVLDVALIVGDSVSEYRASRRAAQLDAARKRDRAARAQAERAEPARPEPARPE